MRDEISLHYSERRHGGLAAATSTPAVFGYAAAQGPMDDKKLTGVISVTAGVTAVTGTGTAFDTELAPGDWIRVEGDGPEAFSQVLSIGSATALTLRHGYRGATAAGVLGVFRPTQVVRAADFLAEADSIIQLDEAGGTISATDPDKGFLLKAGIPTSIVGRHSLVTARTVGAGPNVIWALGKW